MGLVFSWGFFFALGSTEDYENLSREPITFLQSITFALVTLFFLYDFRVHRVLGQE